MKVLDTDSALVADTISLANAIRENDGYHAANALERLVSVIRQLEGDVERLDEVLRQPCPSCDSLKDELDKTKDGLSEVVIDRVFPQGPCHTNILVSHEQAQSSDLRDLSGKIAIKEVTA